MKVKEKQIVIVTEPYAMWTKGGYPHRNNNRPAIIYHENNKKEYWVDGKFVRFFEE